jgi:hypothetical protein
MTSPAVLVVITRGAPMPECSTVTAGGGAPWVFITLTWKLAVSSWAKATPAVASSRHATARLVVFLLSWFSSSISRKHDGWDQPTQVNRARVCQASGGDGKRAISNPSRWVGQPPGGFCRIEQYADRVPEPLGRRRHQRKEPPDRSGGSLGGLGLMRSSRQPWGGSRRTCWARQPAPCGSRRS